MRFFSTLLLLCIMVCVNHAQSIVVKPYLQDASPSSMTIMWEVSDADMAVVDYGTSPFSLDQSVESTTQVGSGTSEIHTAILNGLNDNTKYYYKVSLNSGETSILYTFITPAVASKETSTQLIAISDMQRDNSHPDKFQEIIEEGIASIILSEVGAELSDLESVLIPGDLVVTGGTYSQWKDQFFNPSDSLFPYVPVYPVPGNHEYLGNGLGNFLKYFSLPTNGANGLEEQCWYKDISNIRIIGLNSNTNNAGDQQQLDWLATVLEETCNAEEIDFVFAELHHPFKSELWTPGENDFTGSVIDSLQNFSSECGKPSVHFFGHTHGYSRGQSRDHKHLWINVATAGGAIDNWGEFPNADYPEFVKSQDEYGFVLMEAEAGIEPKFKLTRYSRGDQDEIMDNVIRDELTIFKNEYPPHTPQNVYPSDGESVSSICLRLKASAFSGVLDSMQASHWEVAKSGNFIDSLVLSQWYQNENFYYEVNLQADDDLTDTEVNLAPGETYHWRVRYRDQSLEWSNWSDVTTFFYESGADTLSSNLLLNNGAEDGITSWIGDIESLENGECNSVNPFEGNFNFAVGGVCDNEMEQGTAYQSIDLLGYMDDISIGEGLVSFGGYLRNFSGVDLPEMYLEFYDDSNNLISTTETISTLANSWTYVNRTDSIPTNSTECRLYLRGTRNGGTDNDSYFDALSLFVLKGSCSDCFGESGIDQDGDGFCSDQDCDDTNAGIHPGALEICDGMDNNCDGVFDSNNTIIWTGNANDDQWSTPTNWDQMIVPLACQIVLINNSDDVVVDGSYQCKALEVGPNATVTVLEGSFLNIDSQEDSSIDPACINGQFMIDGKWEVK